MIEALRHLKLYLSSRSDSERGVTTVEYAIMLGLVALAVAGFGAGLSGAVTGIFQDAIDALAAM